MFLFREKFEEILRILKFAQKFIKFLKLFVKSKHFKEY